MVTNTKTLFIALLKAAGADCVCDIGSRDGLQSLLFRDLLPGAVLIAFEANPINFEKMRSNAALKSGRIDIYPFAVTNANSSATLHITDVDYSNPEENTGTSSLLVHQGLRVLKSVEVTTQRIDDFILSRYPNLMNIGLWIDVEGVEYGVLDGMARITDRVIAVHVETAKTPMRAGQKTLSELLPLMDSYDFVPCGSNISAHDSWGDVVFIKRGVQQRLGLEFAICKAKARFTDLIKVDWIAVTLKKRAPAIYRALRRAYIRLSGVKLVR